MQNAEVLTYSRYSKGGQGEYPVRFVVLRWKKGSGHEFSSHMQVKDGTHPDYFIYGHYYTTFDAAFDDAVKRIVENNRDYPSGNVSHIPRFQNGKILMGHRCPI